MTSRRGYYSISNRWAIGAGKRIRSAFEVIDPIGNIQAVVRTATINIAAVIKAVAGTYTYNAIFGLKVDYNYSFPGLTLS